jgi:hypothetical protein
MTGLLAADVDFIWWAFVDAAPASNGTYRVFASLTGNNFLGQLIETSRAADTTGEIDGAVNIASNRAAVMLRRRAGKTTVASVVNGVATIGAESGARAWSPAATTLYIGCYTGSNLQADAPIEGVFARLGTFSDAEMETILEAI